jgi:hypothetical protein
MAIKNRDITIYIGHWNHKIKTIDRVIKMYLAVLLLMKISLEGVLHKIILLNRNRILEVSISSSNNKPCK